MSVMPADTITITPDMFAAIVTFARTEGKSLEDFVRELLRDSLTEREERAEITRRTQIMQELTQETERLSLYTDRVT